MLIEISFGNERCEFDLVDGVVHVGGAKTDEIRIEGMAASLLTLNLVGERLMVTAARAVTIGGVSFPAHVPRLVVPGEKMQLPTGVSLRQVVAKNTPHRSFKATACVLKELVGDDFSPARSRAATLTCLTGQDAGFTFPIAMRETMIGRGDCPVRIRDRAVSRRHARVVRQRSTDFLEVMPDTNGLFVNGEPVTDAAPLHSGDVIELGQSLLRYDGPEQALSADDIEPTVLVKADDLEQPEEIEEIEPEPEETPAPPIAAAAPAAARFSADAVLIGAGALLALIGMAVTISACV